MDVALVFGLGVSAVSSFVRWRFPKIPNVLGSAGLAIGLGVCFLAWIPGVKPLPFFMAIVGLALLAAAAEFQFGKDDHNETNKSEVESAHLPAQAAEANAPLPSPIPTTSSSVNPEAELSPRPAPRATLEIKNQPQSEQPPSPTPSFATPSDANAKETGKAELIDTLADFIDVGEGIKAHFLKTNDTAMIVAAETDWSKRVEHFLSEHVGKAQAVQFRTTEASAWDGTPADRTIVGGRHWGRILARNRLLSTYMINIQGN